MAQSLNQPLNYMLNVPDPSQAVIGGVQQGVQLASMMERTDALAAQRRQTELENQALQVKAQQAEKQRAAIAAFYDTPPEKRTPAMYERIQATAPKEVAENMRASFDALTKEEQRQKLLTGAQVFSALRSGDRETANSILRKQADAARNSGDEVQAKAYENAAEMAAIAPDQAELFVGTSLAALPGGKDFLENVAKQQATQFEAQLQPSKMRKAAGEAEEAETKGRLAEKKIKGEIAKDAASASASYASARKSLAEAKTEDEKRSAAVDLLVAQAALTRSKIEKAMGNPEDARQGALATIDVIDKVLKNEGDARSILGTWNAIPKTFSVKGLEGIKLGAWKPQIAMSEKELDVLANINELGGKTFLQQAQKMRGLGQLTEIEGKKIVEAAGNLSREQSPDRFMATLKTMREALAAGAARKPGSVPKGELIFSGSTQGGGQEPGLTDMSDEALKKALGL
jgi:propanediol dehydratase small subunit